MLIILLVNNLDAGFNTEIILSELKQSLETLYISHCRVTENANNMIRSKIKQNLREPTNEMNIAEFMFNNPELVNKQLGALLDKINLRNIDIANRMVERIKTSLNDSLRTILVNFEDLRTLEANSTILKNNSRLFFRDAVKENSNMVNSILASTIVIVAILLLIK